ncbi:hypothetical protein M413DRAFT_338289 [Hebeloma cylindrosporum]|uniref:Uncharacterized protein n=1 Tax=Hebeloma cylindrosporum TaxID=76867 RepID=A0A0C3CMJ7_HEBCY|nr:hypothetical protein M413DRAFT_338289 [Hebeloma cylindrosporum h7]
MTIPCIIMSGNRPTFYLVPVTQELSNAVIGGVYPTTVTQVLKCVTVAAHIRRVGVGMDDTEYSNFALKHLLAFKALAESRGNPFFEGLWIVTGWSWRIYIKDVWFLFFVSRARRVA